MRLARSGLWPRCGPWSGRLIFTVSGWLMGVRPPVFLSVNAAIWCAQTADRDARPSPPGWSWDRGPWLRQRGSNALSFPSAPHWSSVALWTSMQTNDRKSFSHSSFISASESCFQCWRFHHHAPLTVAYLLGDRSFFLMHASRTAYKKYTTLTYLLTYLLACICGCSTCLIMSLSKSRNRKLIYVMPVLFNDQQYMWSVR